MSEKMPRMVRKQLNIEASQDAALKRLAEERGESESEVVREAIDMLVEREEEERTRRERAAAILEDLFHEWDDSPFESVPRVRSGTGRDATDCSSDDRD